MSLAADYTDFGGLARIYFAGELVRVETERLVLRRFEDNDIDSLFLILSDEEVNRFLPWFPVKTLEETEKHLKARYSELHAVCLKTDNIPIGYVSTGRSPGNDFGYGLRKDFWNKGIITEAAAAMAGRLKEEGLSHITATHDINNPASGAVMKKIGMTYRYTYVEQWQPKNIPVTFRMYQLNFDGSDDRIYMAYWNKYPEHFIEKGIKENKGSKRPAERSAGAERTKST